MRGREGEGRVRERERNKREKERSIKGNHPRLSSLNLATFFLHKLPEIDKITLFLAIYKTTKFQLDNLVYSFNRN